MRANASTAIITPNEVPRKGRAPYEGRTTPAWLPPLGATSTILAPFQMPLLDPPGGHPAKTHGRKIEVPLGKNVGAQPARIQHGRNVDKEPDEAEGNPVVALPQQPQKPTAHNPSAAIPAKTRGSSGVTLL